ncbi:MAG: glycosyltransferase family 39 protein [Candidatus Zixiibacteriota bacterium]
MLAIKLLGRRTIAAEAALLFALSLTSISLSCVLLSDTFYVFLVAIGLLLFVLGLEQNRWFPSCSSGFLFGTALLTRTIGQFWPIAMLFLVIISPCLRRLSTGSKIRIESCGVPYRALAAPVLAIIIAFSWVARNEIVHDVPMLARTSVFGPATVAAQTLESLGGPSFRTSIATWFRSYRDSTQTQTLSTKQTVDVLQYHAMIVFKEHTWRFLTTYAQRAWINATDKMYLHRSLIPRANDMTIHLEHKIKDSYLNYASFILTMLGFIVLLFARKLFTGALLGAVYIYYFSLSGPFPWQSCRYFFPAELAWTIVIAFLLVWLSDLLRHFFKAVDRNR